ncbi:MAG TPA: PQQ-binding-like beta-propeller repeat protein [Gaiellaceae bacterium]|nr:PQQ-binding-like beta-propeller repeat protein [Gaiellaceae bacterium]
MRLALIGAALLVAFVPASATSGTPSTDWTRYGYDAARSNVSPDPHINAGNVGKLKRLQVHLDGTLDSSPIYVAGKIVLTTTYGRTEALNPKNGKVIWRFTPPGYAHVAGSAQITNSAPVESTDRTAVYAAASDGRVRKLRLRDGKVLWTTAITRDPTHEKSTSPLNVSRGLVLVTTGGYIGDAPPYQGHVVSLSEKTGRIQHVWNSLCSDRHAIIVPSTCRSSDSAIWSRNGAAVDPRNGDIVVATGNGPWNGSTDWGDSVAVLSPDASTMLRHWTPADQQHLEDADLDIGSTSPALLQNGYALQGGKDGKLRLLQLDKLPGVNTTTGGELQTVATPGSSLLFSEPAVWKGTWAFVSSSGGTQAWRLEGDHLVSAWSNGNSGNSPVLAGALLYVAGSGGIHVYVPTSGKDVATLSIGSLHWQSPIVADGRVIIGEGNANDHATSGVLDIFHL